MHLLLTAFYLRQLFTYGFAKKRIRFSRYTRMVVQKSNKGHLNKTLKLLRSYLPSKGQERVKIVKMQLPR
jgi:hypothetical protein